MEVFGFFLSKSFSKSFTPLLLLVLSFEFTLKAPVPIKVIIVFLVDRVGSVTYT